MSHNNTYTVVGTSILNGVRKVRFANGLAARIKVLLRNGHTAVNLVECDARFKLDAAKWALTQEAFDAEELAVIKAFVDANG
jgi:hypothetical protein